ncbi:hypothetical protein Hanom_Chr02g00108911 [Helianthus anomalus]
MISLRNFGTKFPFKLGMMWYPGKVHSHPDLTLRRFWAAYQISGRNFFQVGDDVTTRDFKTFPLRVICFKILFYISLYVVSRILFKKNEFGKLLSLS